MGIQDSIFNAMAEFLRRQGYDAVEVTAYEEDVEYEGYCETCYYEQTVVNIEYVTSDGVTLSYMYYGYFAELIRELTD